MKLNTSKSASGAVGASGWRRRHLGKLLLAIGLIAVMAGFFALGIVADRKNIPGRFEGAIAYLRPETAKNYLRSLGAQPERITIDIKYKHFEKLAGWRNTAIARNQITSDLKSYVPAKIRYGGRIMSCKVRLKGEWIRHLYGDKWSLRVKMSGEESLFGMKRFSLQHPATRSYLLECAFLSALRREGVAAIRYDFVNVIVNGKDLGLFALEESPSKQMVEHNERREGIILRFNADYRYGPYRHLPGARPRTETGIGSQQSSELIAYGMDKYDEKPELREQFLVARSLMEKFRAGELPASKVFDCGLMAKYFAISELFGARGAAFDWSDIRFLYNPLTGRLEPLGIEGGSYLPIVLPMGARYTADDAPPHDIHTLLFQDEEFLESYMRELEAVAAPSFARRLLTELEPKLTEKRRILHKEWPQLGFSVDLPLRNAATIQRFFNPSKGLHAYFVEAGESQCVLEIGSIQIMPIEVLGLVTGETELVPVGRTRLPANVDSDSENLFMVPGKSRRGTVRFEQFTFRLAGTGDAIWTDDMMADLQIRYRIAGTDHVHVAEVFPYKRIDDARVLDHLRTWEPNHTEQGFLHVDETTATIRIEPGKWDIGETVVIPAGYTVTAVPGVELNLTDGAMLVSHSALNFVGTEDRPVVVGSEDSTGQGLVILYADGFCSFQNVVFRRLREPTRKGLKLTGAITIYGSPVSFDRCEFSENAAEDGLNIIHSEFTITNSVFYNTTSDAVDCDFSTGSILSSSFSRIGGDALDFSGSRIELEDILVREVTDKALSIGEGTTLIGRDIEIDGASIGIATKDLSNAELTGVQIRKADMGVAVFQKKPEYGPASLMMRDVSMEAVRSRYVVEEHSSLVVDERTIPDDRRDVAVLIYGAE